MPLSSPELMDVVPSGMAVTTVPNIVPRTQEIFGSEYQRSVFTQVEILITDFKTAYRPKRPIRLTCVRKSNYDDARGVIRDVFPFSLILESHSLRFDELCQEHVEDTKILLSDNYVICPFTSIPKFRLLGWKVHHISLSFIYGTSSWAVHETFICGQAQKNIPNKQRLDHWLRNVPRDETFLKSIGEARTKITDVMESISARNHGCAEDVLP